MKNLSSLRICLVFPICIFILSALPGNYASGGTGFNRWINWNPPGQGYVVSLAVDMRSGIIYAAESTEGLFASRDKGLSWEKIFYDETGISNRSRIVKTSILRKSLVYYATEKAVFRSTDGGVSWDKIFTPAKGKINSLDCNPKNPEEFYVSAGSTIYIVKEDGSRKKIYHTGNIKRIHRIVSDPYFPSRIYISFRKGGFLVLTKKQDEWEKEYRFGGQKISSIEPDPWTPGRVYAVSGTDLLISEDGGENWECFPVKRGKKLSGCSSVSLVASKRKREHLFASVTGCGVYKSTDGGRKWNKISPSEPYIISMSELLPERNIIGGSLGDGIYLWRQNSGEWEKSNLLKGYLKNISFGVHGSDDIFAVTYSGRLFISDNGGTIWKEDNISSSTAIVSASSFKKEGKIYYIAVDEDGETYIKKCDEKLWGKAGTFIYEDNKLSLHGSDGCIYAVTDDKVLYSPDGTDWEEVTGTGDGEHITGIALLKGQGEEAFLATDKKIFKIVSGSVSSSLSLPEDCGGISALTINESDRLYISCGSGPSIYTSQDGVSWEEAVKIPSGTTVDSFAVNEDEQGGKDVYIVTGENEILRSVDYGETWITVLKSHGGEDPFNIFINSRKKDFIYAFNEDSGLIKSSSGYSIALNSSLSGWKAKMISFPVDAEKKVNGLLNKYIKGRYRLYRFDAGETLKYEQIKNAGELSPFEGYWLLYSGRIEGDIPGKPYSSAEDVVVELSPGWNLAGNPFAFPLSVANLAVNIDDENVSLFSPDNNFTENSVLIWNGKLRKYKSSEIIKSGQSFWIKNVKEKKIELVISSSADGDFMQ